MKGRVNAKTIIVLIIMLLVVVLGVLGAKTVQTYLSGATEDVLPRNVVPTSSEDGRSVVISWMSDKESMGVVEYGTSPASLLLRAIETGQVTSHKVTLTPLKPGTVYYFRIKIGEEIFDNSGIPYSVKTNEDKGVGVETEVETPTIELKPTSAPAGSGGDTEVISSTCNRQTDYNGDGVVNALDHIQCMKGGTEGVVSVTPTPAGTTPVIPSEASAASEGECKAGVDYDENGVVNSLDMIKCLQNKR